MAHTQRRLVVFDVEGIIIPKRKFLLLQATRNLTILRMVYLLLYGFLYEIGIVSLEISLQKIYFLFANVSLDDFYRTFRTIKLIPDVLLVIQQLKHRGYEIALISSGLPDFLVKELAQQLEIEYAFGLNLKISERKLTGQISGDIVKPGGKAFVLTQLLHIMRISKENCAIVVDDRNNLPMFPYASTRIGYNPDLFVARKCDYAIKGNLMDILPFLDPGDNTPNRLYTRNDAVREAIHMGSFSIPLICNILNVDPQAIATVIIFCTILFFISELLRLSEIQFPIISQITEAAATGEERWEFALSPVFFALSIAIALSIVAPEIGYTAITILTLGDGTARFVGKKWGIHAVPYNKVKKIEGSIAGMVVATLVSLLYTSPLKAVTASAIGMLIETLPLPINDNILIPFTAGITMLGLS